jgi:hypothetical protein
VVFRGRLMTLLATGVLLLATAAPAFAAQPECDPGSGSNCGASLEHRANPSGKGNFGHCHKEFSEGEVPVEGEQSSEFNPSSQNTGEADCRTASGRTTGDTGIGIRARCQPPSEAVAEAQINLQPELEHEVRGGCR